MNEFIHPYLFMEVVRETVSQGESITVDGTGDSMRPFIQPETDRIVLSPLPEKLKVGNICLYTREGGRPVIHRIYRLHENTVDMLGDGQLWIERGIPKSSLIAVVTQRLREGKKPCRCTGFFAELRAKINMKKKIYKLIAKEWIAKLYGKNKKN